jgi:hypothetical protein
MLKGWAHSRWLISSPTLYVSTRSERKPQWTKKNNSAERGRQTAEGKASSANSGKPEGRTMSPNEVTSTSRMEGDIDHITYQRHPSRMESELANFPGAAINSGGKGGGEGSNRG